MGYGYFLGFFICSGFFSRTVAFTRRGWAGLGCVKGMGKGRVGWGRVGVG